MDKMLSEWVRLARIDLESAGVLLKSRKTVFAVSIFESHQAVEKILKAYLCKLGIEIIKTHDLLKLLAVLMEKNKNLLEIAEKVNKLNRYYSRLRYPGGDSITRQEAQEMYKYACEIFETINKNI